MHINDNYFYFVYKGSCFIMLWHSNFTYMDDLLYDSERHFSNFSDVKIKLYAVYRHDCRDSLFVCFWVFFPLEDFFYSFGDVTITDEELQILAYARHSWPLSSEGSLACHTTVTRGTHL